MISMETEKSELNPEFKALLAEMELEVDAEGKLNRLIKFMEGSLSQSGTPRFKNFWDARKLSLDLFKEVPNPLIRTQLWTRYSELSKEARRLKDLLDEESAFNVEQIEMAILALENECQNMAQEIAQQAEVVLPLPIEWLAREFDFYFPHQKELNLLNAHAGRINALRKELIRTDMRIRQKNKFFQRLSKAGDLIFPRRKELIEEVSEKFHQDVKAFRQKYFDNGIQESRFLIRDEIKGLQGAAKVFTLSAQTFKETRLELSQCWDKLKAEEKEQKKFRQEQKEIFKINCHELFTKLQEISERFEQKELTPQATHKELEAFSQEMRERELGRDEVKALREELDKIKGLLRAQETREEEARLSEMAQRDQERKEKVLNFKNQILALITESSHLEHDTILAQKDAILAAIQEAELPRHDKLELEKAFRPLKDILTEKKEERLLNLPENDRQALEQLKELLKERKARRQELREQVEELRKMAGSSGLDFTKALQISQQHLDEKEKLEKLNQSIKELEEKIAEFATRL